jgi:hypothetical protein
LISLSVARKEVFGQWKDVGWAFSQWRGPNRKGVQAIKQIRTEGLLLDIILQRPVRRSDQGV